MSKRRINKQQSTRIAKKQYSYQLDSVGCEPGLVITRYGKLAEIENKRGQRTLCAIRANMDTIVAGDRVLWRPQGEQQGVIVSLCPRDNALLRSHQSGAKPVAANITQLIIVIAAKPELSWPLLDSYLIMAHELQVKAIIVLNKIDLPCDEIQHHLKQSYEQLGHYILKITHRDEARQQQLIQTLNNEVSVFVGQSGVGKSSLIASVLPNEVIATQTISEQSELGRHTTSNSYYYHLPGGGALIDSPGVREFRLDQIDEKDLVAGYPEFARFLGQCKFRNCNHIDSLGCGVRLAVDQGVLSQLRYESFTKLYQKMSAKT